jgi:hypothetical protein
MSTILFYNTAMRKSYSFFLCLLLLTFATPAFADAGTPLMWLGMGHLLILNLFIGIGEGLIIAFVFKAKVGRSIGIMILANYFSAWFGYFTLLPSSDTLSRLMFGQVTLYNAPAFLVTMAVIAWGLTVILEWPFCFWVLCRQAGRLRRSLCASVLAQCASYAFLIYIYYHGSSLSVFQSVSINKNLESPQPAKYWVYYLDPQGSVCRMHPDGSQQTKLYVSVDIKSVRFFPPRLYAFHDPNSNKYDLWATDLSQTTKSKMLLKNFASRAVLAHAAGDPNEFFSEPNQIMLRWFALIDLRPHDSNSPWSAETPTDWAWWGLICHNRADNKDYSVALETPFLDWFSSAVNILPGDFVVFQLGPQIVLLDMPGRKIRLLTFGSAPLVVGAD